VVEVLTRIARHADLLHHPLRPHVLHRGERHDLVEPELLEPERNAGRAASGA
jgi:hypothetical protein